MLILTTERLRLRWFDTADAPFLRRLVNDPDWLANIGDRGVRDDAAARAYVQDRLVAGCWRLGFGFWLVERANDGTALGMCGLTHRESLPEPDLGFAFLPEFRGQGYALEAARACLAYAADALDLDTVLAITAPNNTRSQALLQKLGMAVDPTAPTHDADGANVRFVWRAARVRDASDDAAIERIAQRFDRLFYQRGPQPPTLPCLPQLCGPEVVFRQFYDGAGIASVGLQEFVQACAADFATAVTEHRVVERSPSTERQEPGAWRRSRFVAEGRRRGVPFRCEGQRAMQLVRGPRGWRIAEVAWRVDGAKGGHGPVPPGPPAR
ncbi:MAG: GNAT family N-acetyltransferase [Planctomycetes bacterium]|nr:GNAT family N-acetyltransferase [Planctomycetota bacterium]